MFWFGVIVLCAIPLWWLKRHRRAAEDPVEDLDELEQAERDVRDLGTFATPEDAEDDLPDWGPGAP